MSKIKKRLCKNCGIGEIRPLAKKGRFARYKSMPRLAIPSDLTIPTCNHCGAEWLDANTAKALDKALDAEFREELRQRAIRAIEEIGKYVSQRKLEALLGLSQGYLSKLRSGDRDTSAELVSQLALISKDPKHRVHELEIFWEH
jgi:hypothetical protein